MKVNRNFKYYFLFFFFFFSAFKTQQKIKQSLHEIIRASSLSIIFMKFSFRPVYPTMVVKNFKYKENYNSWKMYLQVKISTLIDIFTYMLPTSPHSLSAIITLPQILSSPLRQRWLELLGYWYFRKCLCDNCIPSFLPLLIFDWRTFSRRVTARWWRQSAKISEKSVSTNQNSRNRWCLIVRCAFGLYDLFSNVMTLHFCK